MNILRPAYLNLKYKTAGKIINADIVMNQAFWIGVYPGINNKRLAYVKETIASFLSQFK